MNLKYRLKGRFLEILRFLEGFNALELEFLKVFLQIPLFGGFIP